MIALTGLMLFAFTQCGNGNSGNGETTKNEESTKTEETVASEPTISLPYHLEYSLVRNEVGYVKERNVLNVLLNKSEKLIVNGRPSSLIKDEIVDFITPDPTKEYAPEFEIKHFDGLGDVMVSKGVVCFLYQHTSIQNWDLYDKDGVGDYTLNAFCEVIDEMMEAYDEAREGLAMKVYHKHLDQLSPEQISEIREAVPVRVVGLGEYVEYYVEVVDDDVETEEGVEHLKINNAFLEACMLKRGDCYGKIQLIDEFKKHTSSYPFYHEVYDPSNVSSLFEE